MGRLAAAIFFAPLVGRRDCDKEPTVMTMKVELAPDVQAGLLAQAQANGLSLEAYVEQVLRERSREAAAHPALTRSQIAGQRIRELRKGITLGGIAIKELIEEGRE
jgi:hypothetical protein